MGSVWLFHISICCSEDVLGMEVYTDLALHIQQWTTVKQAPFSVEKRIAITIWNLAIQVLGPLQTISALAS